jgi:hypothetical protein
VENAKKENNMVMHFGILFVDNRQNLDYNITATHKSAKVRHSSPRFLGGKQNEKTEKASCCPAGTVHGRVHGGLRQQQHHDHFQ